MRLVQSLPVYFPQTPVPPTREILEISNALDVASTICIRASFVPTIGVVFLSNLTAPNQFLTSLATYLDLTVSPIIAMAAVAQSTMSPQAAWLTVQPSFDLLIAATPPFMAGSFGTLFWSAIILTIRTAILPT